MQNIDFGTIFFDEQRTFTVNLLNNNQHSSSFSVLIMSQQGAAAGKEGSGTERGTERDRPPSSKDGEKPKGKKDGESEGEVAALRDDRVDITVSPSEGVCVLES